MKKQLLKTSILASGALAVALVAAAPAEASHFRGSAAVPTVSAGGVVTLTTTSFWRPTWAGQGSPSTINVSGGVGTVGQSSFSDSTADSRFTKETQSHVFTLPGAGIYNITSGSNARVAGIHNAGTTSWTMNSNIYWDGSTANEPILFDFSTINFELQRGVAEVRSLNASSNNAGTLSYNQTIGDGITSFAPSQTMDTANGIFSFTTAGTTSMLDNTGGNDGADYAFAGNIINTDGSSVEFDWMWDAVDQTTAPNLSPVATDIVINIFAGQTANGNVSGSDPNPGDTVTLTPNADPASAVLASIFNSAPGNPSNGTFSWDSTGSALGSYLFTYVASDGSKTDTGTILVNVLSSIAEPATLGLFGLGLAGLGLMSRRRRQES